MILPLGMWTLLRFHSAIHINRGRRYIEFGSGWSVKLNRCTAAADSIHEIEDIASWVVFSVSL